MKFIKSYYPILFESISSFFSGFLTFALIFKDAYNDEIYEVFGLTFILVLLSAVVIFILKLAYTIDASNKFRGATATAWYILIWFTSNYILGHYNFNVIMKRKDIKTFVVFYIISFIASFVFGMMTFKILM